MAEPTVVYCTVRDGDHELHLECRMSDGQKGAFVLVSIEFPELAQDICDYLNSHSPPDPIAVPVIVYDKWMSILGEFGDNRLLAMREQMRQILTVQADQLRQSSPQER